MSLYEDKVFPVLLDWATRPLHTGTAYTLIRQAHGKVLELGVGTGANFRSILISQAKYTALSPPGPAGAGGRHRTPVQPT